MNPKREKRTMLIYTRTFIKVTHDKYDTYTSLSLMTLSELHNTYPGTKIEYWDDVAKEYVYFVVDANYADYTVVKDDYPSNITPAAVDVYPDVPGFLPRIKHKPITYIDADCSGYVLRKAKDTKRPGRYTDPNTDPTCQQLYHTVEYNTQDMWIRRGDRTGSNIADTTMAIIDDVVYPIVPSDNCDWAIILGAQPHVNATRTTCIGLLCWPCHVKHRSIDLNNALISHYVGTDYTGGVLVTLPEPMLDTERYMLHLAGRLLLPGEAFVILSPTTFVIHLDKTYWVEWMTEDYHMLYDNGDGLSQLGWTSDTVINHVFDHVTTSLTGVVTDYINVTAYTVQDQVITGQYKLCDEPELPLMNSKGTMLCYCKRYNKQENKWNVMTKIPDDLLTGDDVTSDHFTPPVPIKGIGIWLSINIGV